MDSPALALLIAGFGALLIALGFQRQMQHAIWSGVSYGVIGALMMLVGGLMFAVALNINTYERSPTSQPLAQITIEQSEQKTFRISLMRIPSGDLQVFQLRGDSWHVTARQLTWYGWTQLIGMHSNTRLQTLISNGSDSNFYSLSRNTGIDLASLPLRFPITQNILQSGVLTSIDYPLQDGLRYQINVSDTGLDIRAINQPK
ncbi:MAG TPA: hypothetical protein VHL14_15470 [Steroidobacteraceae bacterium]|nr:hypothetical protein [Steroidobacteraceae bacterium]